jgi:adenine-specific DNA-methyltransferase
VHKEKLQQRRDNSLKGALARGRWDVMALPKTAIDFSGPKIVCPQRSKINTFGYNECDWYASADVYYITKPNDSYSLKYILGLLNSKLYYVWLYNKGKRKGETLELYQKPLSEVPIKCVSQEVQDSIVSMVDEIMDL